VRSANGDLTTISVDGGITLASGINAEGVIVGAYVDANGKEHGFIRTP
jgi:probable HAF family extracellular repeat protein